MNNILSDKLLKTKKGKRNNKYAIVLSIIVFIMFMTYIVIDSLNPIESKEIAMLVGIVGIFPAYFIGKIIGAIEVIADKQK